MMILGNSRWGSMLCKTRDESNPLVQEADFFKKKII